MLARRRQRREEKRKHRAVETTAREVVRVELDQWRNRVAQAKKETEEKRAIYQLQERELREQYETARRQLEKRRATLLATTSLIPYTNTIKDTSNFRVPASLLTLQARLCLHVHCLCVHEELLLKTKEQGWDTIAWMEDVSRQLRQLTQKHISNLHTQIQDVISMLKDINPEFQVPENIQEILQQQENASAETGMEEPIIGNHLNLDGGGSEHEVGLTDPNAPTNPEKSKEESFMDFLQRYEQRKAHQEKADQMRLAEFRSRGNDNTAHGSNKNPFTARRVVVGKRLKNYASKLFHTNTAGEATTDGGAITENMEDSMRFDDVHTGSNHMSSPYDSTINEESNSSLASATGGPRWLPFRRSTSAQLSQSESNLDTSWTLGSSLRGLRTRGYRRTFGGNGMETQAELGESVNNEEGEDGKVEEEKVEDNNNEKSNEYEEENGETHNDSPTSGDKQVETTLRERSTSPASALKNKLKAPGISSKLCESARF